MPTCLPRAAASSLVAPERVLSTIDPGRYIPAPVTPPVPSPATPPVLAKLAAAHAVFVTRKRKEREEAQREHVEWILRTADQIDLASARRRQRRAERQAEYLAWVLQTSIAADWNADPATDIH